MNLIKLLYICCLLFSATSKGEGFKKFSSVSDMIEDRNDFSKEAGTFEVLTANPLKIRLSVEVYPIESADVVRDQNEQALVYGILYTFIYTDVNEISVTAYPLEVLPNRKQKKSLKDMSVTLKVNRAQVFSIIQSIKPIKSFEDLLVLREYGGIKMLDKSDLFISLYNEGEDVKPPGASFPVNATFKRRV